NRRNILIGEVWEDASNKVAYGVRKHYFNGSQLDSVMNYVYKNAIISFLRENNVLHLRNAIRRILNNYPQDVVNKLMNVLDTHDTARIINNFAYVLNPPKDKAAQYRMTELEYQNALRKMKMAVILQFTLPGVPCIYYGDEVGLSGFDDPFCRRAFPWDNINHELLTWYRQLGKIRNDKVFVDGEYQEILAQNNIFIFAREKISKVIIIINNSDEDYNYPISGFDMLEEKYVDKANVSSQSGMIIKVK
ncbi:MAG TPA: alpha-amylase family glycosyl hydrolase, partial [Bacilli bacterium]